MELNKEQTEKNKWQKETTMRTQTLQYKLKQGAFFTSLKPWHAIFIMVVPTIISVVVFSTYQIFGKLIVTQWGWSSIIFHYRFIIDITPDEALQIVNIATTYATIPYLIAVSFALLISINYSKSKIEKTTHSFGNGCLISLLSSIVFMIVMNFIIPSIIEFQTGSALVINHNIRKIIFDEAVRFSRILVLASPLLFFANFFLSLLRNEGKIIISTLIIVISCLINIMIVFIFVIPANLGIVGTAYATIITWFLIFIIAIILIYYDDLDMRINFHHLKLKPALILNFLIIGLISLLETAGQSILIIMIVKILNTLSPLINYPNGTVNVSISVYIQLYGAIIPWLVLINALCIGVSQGARILLGYVYRTKNYYYFWQLTWRLIILLLVLLSLFLLLVGLFGEYLMNIFGINLAMAKYFKSYIIIYFAFYPLATLHFSAILFYQGINRSKIALLASLPKTIIMPILCLSLGYIFARNTSNGFYFYMLVGFIDLFSAFILLPMLITTFSKLRPWQDFDMIEVETLNLK
ncbi:MAG: MATE family efflux transporter [Spiroplasma sp.]